MKQPRTIYDVLAMLLEYHDRTALRYRELATACVDSQTDILLDHLVELQTQSAQMIRGEMEHLSPEHSTYLITGPQLTHDTIHSSDNCCGDNPSFDDTLECALVPDPRLTELLDRMTDCTAAESVVELAQRLREFETTKDRQIASFTRRD